MVTNKVYLHITQTQMEDAKKNNWFRDFVGKYIDKVRYIDKVVDKYIDKTS